MVIAQDNLRMQTFGTRQDGRAAHQEVRVRPNQNPWTVSKTRAGGFDQRIESNILESNGWLTDLGYIRAKRIRRIPVSQKVAGGMKAVRELGAVLRKFAGQREKQ